MATTTSVFCCFNRKDDFKSGRKDKKFLFPLFCLLSPCLHMAEMVQPFNYSKNLSMNVFNLLSFFTFVTVFPLYFTNFH